MKWLIRKYKDVEQLDLKNEDGDPGLEAELNKLGYVKWITYPIALNPPYTDDELKAIDLWGAGRVRSPLAGRSAAGRRKYEIFCGGFILYHDMVFKTYQKGKGYTTDDNGELVLKDYTSGDVIVKNPKPERTYNINDYEHKMYFEWVNEKGPDHDKVTIYITETPAEFNSNPPPVSPPPPPES